MRRFRANPDADVARLAAGHHGIVTLDDLLKAGLSEAAVRRRVATGRVHRLHRGIYAVGHPGVSAEGRWMAAVKALGDGAALSHRSAAELWRLLPDAAGPVHVTVPGHGGRDRRAGVRVHRSRSLTAAAITRRERIPVTRPARTIADLRRSEDAETVRRAIREAEFLGLPLDDAGVGADRTRSELERAFLQLCRKHRLPMPEVNARVDRFTVDFLWPDARLVVEVDGYAAHRGRQAFEDDRARDVRLKRHGYEVVRFTYRQVTEDPAGVAAALRELLAVRGA